MNKYVKSFLHRGLIFGGFGPIILGLVFFIIEKTGVDLMLSGADILLATVSIYVLTFVQAGASVFNQIEDWPIAKSLLFHFSTLFIIYSLCYLVNSWIPFEPIAILVFLLSFALTYFIIWFTVYLCVKAYTKRLNATLEREK